MCFSKAQYVRQIRTAYIDPFELKSGKVCFIKGRKGQVGIRKPGIQKGYGLEPCKPEISIFEMTVVDLTVLEFNAKAANSIKHIAWGNGFRCGLR